jgi:proline dehydrogenase
MNEQRLPAVHPRIHFAHLYRVADHLTYALAGKGYQACKYVPFGPAQFVIPYLIRRIHENSSMHNGLSFRSQLIQPLGMLGRAGEERELLARELRRRQQAKQ